MRYFFKTILKFASSKESVPKPAAGLWSQTSEILRTPKGVGRKFLRGVGATKKKTKK